MKKTQQKTNIYITWANFTYIFVKHTHLQKQCFLICVWEIGSKEEMKWCRDRKEYTVPRLLLCLLIGCTVTHSHTHTPHKSKSQHFVWNLQNGTWKGERGGVCKHSSNLGLLQPKEKWSETKGGSILIVTLQGWDRKKLLSLDQIHLAEINLCSLSAKPTTLPRSLHLRRIFKTTKPSFIKTPVMVAQMKVRPEKGDLIFWNLTFSMNEQRMRGKHKLAKWWLLRWVLFLFFTKASAQNRISSFLFPKHQNNF